MAEAALVTTPQPEPVVRVRGFYKRYRKHVAVDSVDLEIQPGEVYGLIGPDGAGKSSLMKAIAGVLSFEGGELEVFGIKVDSEASAERVKSRLGFMPQGLGLNLYHDLSVEENIDFFAQLRQVPAKVLVERKRKLFAMTRLDKFRDRPMKHLSGGMKQKLGLVCTLIHEPDLIILDEPTTGVDPVSRRDFWAILAELLRERGITALVSTAYMDEATRFHNLSLMYGGQVLAAGEPDSMRRQASGSLVEFLAQPQVEALDQIKIHYPQAEAVGPQLRVFMDDQLPDAAIHTVSDLLSGFSLKKLQAVEPELEDSFVALLRQRKLAEQESVSNDHTSLSNDSLSDETIAIEAHGLTRDFDGFRAVDQASFRVRQGEIFGLLGANGAGKTTVIKMLTGILQPTEGEGHTAGADMRRAAQTIKERIGYTSQSFSLYQDMTVMENIRLYARIYGVRRHELNQRIKQVVELAGLQGLEGRLAGKLPMGIRQRLALGCSLVHRPRILFLDEPTSGVDPIGRRRFWDILVHLSRVEQVAILITTHYMSEAEHCDHLALMHAGRIIADDSPEAMKQDLQEDAGELLEITVDQPLVVLELLEQTGFEGVALFGKRIHLLAKDTKKAETQIRALLTSRSLQLLNIKPHTLTLEDVFVYRIMALEKQERQL
jgi:drug efflux transport system ATP-binding protein